MSVVRVLHISDTHLRESATVSLARDAPGQDPRSRLVTVLDAVLASGFSPDAVVHSGDITDEGSGDAAVQTRDLLLRLAPVVLGVPGNHDDPASVLEVFGEPVADVGGWRIAGLDSTIPDQTHGRARSLAEVNALTDAPTLLVMHHPYRCNSTHEWFRVEGRAEFRESLRRQANVKAVLTGHTHEPYETRESWGLALLGAPSTYYGIRHDGPHMHFDQVVTGARLVELTEEGSVTSRVLVG